MTSGSIKELSLIINYFCIAICSANTIVIRGCNNTRTFTRHNGTNKCTNYTGHSFYTDLFIIVINFDLTLNVVVVFNFASVYSI